MQHLAALASQVGATTQRASHRAPPCAPAATFLALGNGAPDLSATISAVRGGQYPMALGALTGAGWLWYTAP